MEAPSQQAAFALGRRVPGRGAQLPAPAGLPRGRRALRCGRAPRVRARHRDGPGAARPAAALQACRACAALGEGLLGRRCSSCGTDEILRDLPPLSALRVSAGMLCICAIRSTVRSTVHGAVHCLLSGEPVRVLSKCHGSQLGACFSWAALACMLDMPSTRSGPGASSAQGGRGRVAGAHAARAGAGERRRRRGRRRGQRRLHRRGDQLPGAARRSPPGTTRPRVPPPLRHHVLVLRMWACPYFR